MSSPPAGPGPDRALRALIRAGDHEAFGVLYADHHHEVFAAAYRLTGNRSTAEEVVAETFLVAWRRREALEVGDRPVRGWLLAIATKLALNLRRSARRRAAFLASGRADPLPVADFADDVDDRLDAERLIRRTRRALGALSRVELEVVSLCAWSGLSYADAATELGVPVGTVRSRLNRARRRLRELADPPRRHDPPPDPPPDPAASCSALPSTPTPDPRRADR